MTTRSSPPAMEGTSQEGLSATQHNASKKMKSMPDDKQRRQQPPQDKDMSMCGFCHRYVSEPGYFPEPRSSFLEQEEAFLGHGDLPNPMGGLDAGRQLVDTLVIVQEVHDLGGQVHVLRLSLLPEGVDILEEGGVHLLLID